ncbi:MAG: dihydropteroate synthase [Acidiferrobacteraceae bacterium]
MGILNVTPDSFYDGGVFFRPERAIEHAHRMVDEGAQVIDIGGESTRPGAAPVELREELRRVIPVIAALVDSGLPVPISVDTSRPEVMKAAVAAGAGMINDIRALQVPGALEAAAGAGVPVCLMHMQGDPGSMQCQPNYVDVVSEVTAFLRSRVDAAVAAGIPRSRLLVDPGFGFGKTVDQNLSLLRELSALKSLGLPILVGLSRKSMIGVLTGAPATDRLSGSLVLAVLALKEGASVLRVHDVGPTCEAVLLYDAIYGAGSQQ